MNPMKKFLWVLKKVLLGESEESLLTQYIKELNKRGSHLTWRHDYDEGDDGNTTHTIIVIDWDKSCDIVAEGDSPREVLSQLRAQNNFA